MVHEFGHFIVARKNGIRVEEFGLGLPPRIFGRKFGDTLYSLNLLPFGGFVKLTGEDVTEGVSTEESEFKKDPVIDPNSFAAKTPLQRFAVLIAGVFMNFVLAVVLFYVYLFSTGFKTDYMPLFFDYNFKFGSQNIVGTVVSNVAKDSPAEKAGMQLGEALVAINGVSVKDINDVRAANLKGAGSEMTYTMLDLQDPTKNITRDVKATPTLDSNGSAIIGVYLSKAVSVSYASPIDKLFSGFMQSYNVLSYSMNGMKNLIGVSVATHDIQPVSEGVSGPVGIYNIVGGILKYSGSRVVLNMINYVALMSLSLAFMNILPFPALDGGRVVFVVFEGVTKKKINPNIEARVHQIGMLFLLALVAVISLKDLFLK